MMTPSIGSFRGCSGSNDELIDSSLRSSAIAVVKKASISSNDFSCRAIQYHKIHDTKIYMHGKFVTWSSTSAGFNNNFAATRRPYSFCCLTLMNEYDDGSLDVRQNSGITLVGSVVGMSSSEPKVLRDAVALGGGDKECESANKYSDEKFLSKIPRGLLSR